MFGSKPESSDKIDADAQTPVNIDHIGINVHYFWEEVGNSVQIDNT